MDLDSVEFSESLSFRTKKIFRYSFKLNNFACFVYGRVILCVMRHKQVIFDCT